MKVRKLGTLVGLLSAITFVALDQQVSASPIYHSLASGMFSQDWSNTGLITTDDNWSGVPSVDGYRGDNLTVATGVDPQTVVAFDGGTAVLDVNANRSDPNLFVTGGVTEFDGIPDPVVALQGSGTADAPFLIFYMDSTGQENVTFKFKLRDIDGSTDNSTQQVALQYRIGTIGNFTNVPLSYVPDASTGPSLATLVTPVVATDPAWSNVPQLQLRVITTNAVGNDEWIGVDDCMATSTKIIPEPASAVLMVLAGLGLVGIGRRNVR